MLLLAEPETDSQAGFEEDNWVDQARAHRDKVNAPGSR
jgi:hypothetical protein